MSAGAGLAGRHPPRHPRLYVDIRCGQGRSYGFCHFVVAPAVFHTEPAARTGMGSAIPDGADVIRKAALRTPSPWALRTEA